MTITKKDLEAMADKFAREHGYPTCPKWLLSRKSFLAGFLAGRDASAMVCEREYKLGLVSRAVLIKVEKEIKNLGSDNGL